MIAALLRRAYECFDGGLVGRRGAWRLVDRRVDVRIVAASGVDPGFRLPELPHDSRHAA